MIPESLRTQISLVSLYLEAYTIEADSWWLILRVLFRSSYRNLLSNLNGWLIEARNVKRLMNNYQWPEGDIKLQFDGAVSAAEAFIEKNRKRYW